MILSVSRRTDIPAFYGDWFSNRLEEGYVLVRNPFNLHHVSRIELNSEDIDCIVFWTKNPGPFMSKLDSLQNFKYYFQFTLNTYDESIERNLPPLEKRIRTFVELSGIVGKGRLVWRYDPIIVSDRLNSKYHFRAFEKLASRLAPHARRCVISFLDLYGKTRKNFGIAHTISEAEMRMIGAGLAEIARGYDLEIETCAEAVDLSNLGIGHGKCVDDRIISEITGKDFSLSKDRYQRAFCGCATSVDIGEYNSCQNGCLYCYANYDDETVRLNKCLHDPGSPLLIGVLSPEDQIVERQKKGSGQLKLLK